MKKRDIVYVLRRDWGWSGLKGKENNVEDIDWTLQDQLGNDGIGDDKVL